MDLVQISQEKPGRPARRRHPDWIKVRIPGGASYQHLKHTLRSLQLNTVCEDALCPNLGECWGRGVATFMILGDICTRGCRYCAVQKGRPVGLDSQEPQRVGEAAARMQLRHVVITSVNRDDLEDGGAAHFAATVRAVRERKDGCTIEVLIPDFQGSRAALQTVLEAQPDILNHNTETVPRLYRRVRPGGRYRWSLDILAQAKDMFPGVLSKTGLMLGLGEEKDEVLAVMQDLREINVDICTFGQYLQPTLKHLPVERYYQPQEFAELAEIGHAMGFLRVESGPLVRSSYHADEQARAAMEPPVVA